MKTKCPYCDYLATEHETLKEEKNPFPGDISFCINCGEVSVFDGDKLIKIDVTKLDESTKQELKDIEIAWLRSRARRNAK